MPETWVPPQTRYECSSSREYPFNLAKPSFQPSTIYCFVKWVRYFFFFVLFSPPPPHFRVCFDSIDYRSVLDVLIFHLLSWESISHWDLGFIIMLGWLAHEPKLLTCLYFHCIEITSTQLVVPTFLHEFGAQTVVFFFVYQVLYRLSYHISHDTSFNWSLTYHVDQWFSTFLMLLLFNSSS